MLAKGDYVRLKMAPATRMGTIENIKIERSKVRYQFRQDRRFREALRGLFSRLGSLNLYWSLASRLAATMYAP